MDLQAKMLSLQSGVTSVSFVDHNSRRSTFVKTVSSVVIPPRSEVIMAVRISKDFSANQGMVEPLSSLASRHHLLGAKCLVNIENGQAVYQVLNPTNGTVFLPQNYRIATITHVDCIEVLEERSDSEQSDANVGEDMFIQIAKDLGIELTGDTWSEQQKRQILQLIGKNRHVFSKDISELGETKVYQHKVDTGHASPIRQCFYRTSPAIKLEIERQVEELLDNGIIEPSTSEWQSPVVLVKKKNGTYRFAVDYRKLNAVTKPMSFPLPRLEDVFDSLGEKQPTVFSVLDLASGFWQIPLDPETKHKTAFTTHHGVFQWNKLPFGLMNSPASFQLVMAEVLRGLNWKSVLVYVDDILIFSKSFDEHLTHLEEVFGRLSQAGLKLQPSKCVFGAPSVKYLGHVIDKEGVHVDHQKTKVVDNFPTPSNTSEVKGFLGLCNYYRRFIQGFAEIAAPLTQLLKKNSPFVWSDECNKAFLQLKHGLTTAPILAYPNMDRPFVLYTDASGSAIGYILGQIDDQNRERVIAYGGRALKDNEKKWSISERECFALVEAIRAFHP